MLTYIHITLPLDPLVYSPKLFKITLDTEIGDLPGNGFELENNRTDVIKSLGINILQLFKYPKPNLFQAHNSRVQIIPGFYRGCFGCP